MTSIIPAAQRRRSFGEELGAGINRGLQMGGQMMQENDQQEAIKNLMGENGEQYANLPREFQVELLKQQGKSGQMREKQDFLGKLFGGGNKEQNDQRSRQNEGQFDPSEIPDETILQLAAVDPVLGREARMAKDSALKQKARIEERDFQREKLGRREETELSKPVLLEMNEIRKNIPLQEQAIQDIKEAAPEVSALDYFADVTGFEPLRSAEGAKLKTGIKDFFLSDLSRAGARPNQWIEQQLADALPKIGRSPEANLITAEGLKFKVDLAKKRVEIIDKLADQDRKKFGFVKGDIDSRASKEMKKYVIDRQKQLQDNIKKIKSDYKGVKTKFQVKGPDGSIYEIESNDLDEALQHGYERIQ